MNLTSQIQEAAIYCRVSTDDQAERGTIESQIEFAEKYCDLHNIRLVKIYKDDGITGTLPLQERPAGAELIADAKEGLFSALLVFKLDRLGRATRVILNAIHDLEEHGVKLKSMTEPFDTGDASGRFLLTILAGVADLERSNILERLQLGTNRAAAEGKWLGGIVPYGYIVNDDGFLEVNETEIPGTGMSEADVIRLIFRLLNEEKLSTIAIARRLNALGIPPAYVLHGIGGKRRKHTMGKWFQGRVLSMAKSTTYAGIHHYGKRSQRKRETIERKVPAIVSMEEWESAQVVMHNNRLMSPRNAKNKYLLRGLIKCSLCGSNYSGISSKGARYYACNGRNAYLRLEREKCFAHSINMQWIDSAVWDDCLRYIDNPELVVEVIQEKRGKEEASGINEQILLLENQLEECKEERERVTALYRTKLISLDEVTKQLQKTAEKKDALKQELSTLKSRPQPAPAFVQEETARQTLQRIQDKLSSEEEICFDLKQEIVRTLVNKITAISTDDGVIIQVHYAFGDNSGPFPDKNTKVAIHTGMDSLPLPK